MKVIIAGGRDYTDYSYVEKMCNIILAGIVEEEEIEIIGGRCSTGLLTYTTENDVKVYGVDGLGERYAKEKGYKFTPFPANWKKYRYGAGPIRNKEMAKCAAPTGMLIAFWDQMSAGTRNMILEAKRNKLKVHVIDINN